jgi:tetratricopeptide (TPR) repeat protein
MDFKNQIELELYFSDHFDTILFPVLADIYLKKNDLKRARKVCDIGLNYHKNDVSGWFIYSKIEKAEGHLKEAEKALEKVLLYSNNHLDAAEMLCEVQTILGRASNRLLKSWQYVLKINPNNEIALRFIDKFNSKSNNNGKKVLKLKKVKVPEIIPQKSFTPRLEGIEKTIGEGISEPLKISSRLATFTLVSVLKNQGLFDEALNVLDSLEKKGENLESITFEREIIKTLIKKSNKD